MEKSNLHKAKLILCSGIYKHTDSLLFNEYSIENLVMYTYLLTYLSYSHGLWL